MPDPFLEARGAPPDLTLRGDRAGLERLRALLAWVLDGDRIGGVDYWGGPHGTRVRLAVERVEGRPPPAWGSPEWVEEGEIRSMEALLGQDVELTGLRKDEDEG